MHAAAGVHPKGRRWRWITMMARASDAIPVVEVAERPVPGARCPSAEDLGAELDRICASAWAALDRDDATAARAAAARAVRLARRIGEPCLEGTARVIYGRTLGFSGSLRAGLGQVHRAERLLEGAALGRALVQRSALLYKMGEPAAALDACRQALHLLPDDADQDRARGLNIIGVVLLYLGASQQARGSLIEAERLHRLGGRPTQAAQTLTNLAMAQARLGDLIGALRSFDDAEHQLRSLGLAPGQHTVAKADVLLDAGLLREVRGELPQVIEGLDATGMRVDAAEAVLYLALGLVGLGDPGAVGAARDAHQRFHHAGSHGWAAIASLVQVRAAWSAGDVSEPSLAMARRVVAALGRRQLRSYELDAQLLCGQLAGTAGRLDEARRRLGLVAAGRQRGTVRQRTMGWEALARLRLLEGNRRGALRAADAGLRVVERHRDALGATDLRAGASSQGVELACFGLRLASDVCDSWSVLRWGERWRAGALYRRPIIPPADPVVAEVLVELREAAVAIRAQAAAGQPSPELERRMARLEHVLADRVRSIATTQPGGTAAASGRSDQDELRASLGQRALVEYIECQGQLMVVVLDEHRCVLRRLGDAAGAGRLARATSFALRKLAWLKPASPAVPAAVAGFSARLDALRAVLVDPIRQLLGDRELVVVPTGPLHAVPWQVLVDADRVIAVAPSATLWRRARGAARSQGAVVAVAGPGLDGAVQEIEAVRRHHVDPLVRTGAGASVKEVNEAIDGARLVHLAAHGDIRGDNPFFSSFRLADGPQTVYDLQCLAKAPEVVVLSACNSALSQVDAGDELLGLVACLLGLGTTTAVAAVLPISDLATVALMDRLHERLAAGDSPGRALVAATSQVDRSDPAAIAAAAAFVCLGAA